VRLAAAAARNNADWCDAFCRRHGICGTFERHCWSSARRTPPRYPDAVTLVQGVAPELLLARIDAGEGCSVKDSFDDVDLGTSGFRPLFRAEWIAHRETPPSAGGWATVRADGLIAELAGAGSASATRSAGVIGLTNVVAPEGDFAAALLAAAGAAVAHFGPLPVVGYETGPALEAAHEAGFRSIGELTVWIR
jgi:hypothetical protein